MARNRSARVLIGMSSHLVFAQRRHRLVHRGRLSVLLDECYPNLLTIVDCEMLVVAALFFAGKEAGDSAFFLMALESGRETSECWGKIRVHFDV